MVAGLYVDLLGTVVGQFESLTRSFAIQTDPLPVCDSQPRVHINRLLCLWSPTAQAPGGTGLRVPSVRAGDVQGPQRRYQ